MKRFNGVFLLRIGLSGGLFWCTLPLLASPSTVQVGGCLHGVTNFPKITDAVAAVSPGGTVKVCPGTYAEQVNIFTPLTLEGVTIGNSDRALITVPGTGLASNIDSIFNTTPIVAQVLADASGTVNISNITVDGGGNNQNNLVVLAGIFYASGTSGTINGVTTELQNGNGRGVGIWAENGHGSLASVTIENCDVHDVDFEGIFVGSNQTPPTLTATVKGNMIAAGGNSGIVDQAAGSITNNIITNGNISAGNAASNDVSNNIITGGNIAVFQFGATVKFNTIFVSFNDGITLNSSKATVESNTIMEALFAIDFACHTGNIVSGNSISDALVGIASVPSSQTVTNTYHNVDHIRSGGC